MIGKNFKFKGETIPTQYAESTANWVVDSVDWANVLVQNSQIDNQFWHGTLANPTYSRGRLITITGVIFSPTKTTRGSTRNIIDELFQLEYFPEQGEGFYDLEFEDDDGVDKVISAKVYSKPEYEHNLGSPIINFRVNLFSEDGIVRGDTLVSQSGNYGFIGGTVLPCTLPVTLSAVDGEITATNAGNWVAPVTITITGEISNPKIINLTTGKYFGVDIDINGEELIINSDEKTVTVNGTDFLYKRSAGSSFIFANPDDNEFVLIGDDYDSTDLTKVDFTIEFYSTWK